MTLEEHKVASVTSPITVAETDTEATNLENPNSPVSGNLPPPCETAMSVFPQTASSNVPAPSRRAPFVVEETDFELLTLASVLESIHQQFYEQYDKCRQSSEDRTKQHKADVKMILPRIKRTVLGGLHIVFSGIIPNNHGSPETTEIWKLAESFGASCHHNLGRQITHVVANKVSDCAQD
jgi:hypothetical protein